MIETLKGSKTCQIVNCFHYLFASAYQVRLVPGGEEPFYRASRQGEPAEIIFRADYPASALHEVAHWCLAGWQRRQQDDYGYWYISERSVQQQRAFEVVESKPQALEWLFAEAAGVAFRVSSDQVDRLPSDAFVEQVRRSKCELINRLPRRAETFRKGLLALGLHPLEGP